MLWISFELQLDISYFIVNRKDDFFLNGYLFHFAELKQSGVYFDSRAAKRVQMISLFAFLLFIWWVPLLDIAMTFQ